MRDVLPNIHEMGGFYVFQQDSAPVHWAREMIELLENETQISYHHHFGHPTVQTWVLWTTRSDAGTCVQISD